MVITTSLKIISALSFRWTVMSYTEERERESVRAMPFGNFCNWPSLTMPLQCRLQIAKQ